MKVFNPDDKRSTNLFRLFLAAMAAVVSIWALLNCFYLTPPQIGVLAGLFCLSFIAGLFPIKVPDTQTTVSAADAITFLALIYLGIPAGVIVAGIAAFAGGLRDEGKVEEKLTGAAISIVGAFGAGQAFYFALNHYAGISQKPLANGLLEIEGFALVLVIAAFAQFLLTSVFSGLFLAVKNNQLFVKIWSQGILSCSWSCFLGALAAGTVQYSEAHWGAAHGVVSLPLVALPYIAYKLHFRRMNEKNHEISEINRVQLAAVQTLAAAVDAREQTSPGHTRRVQIYAVGLANALRLPADDVKALEAAALLHDIGKLAVPDHILNKPGRLSRPEMDKVKVHAVVGADILKKVDFPYPVVPTVLYHHERWDGDGYPEGLCGEEIPLTARVLAIADAYDSMREPRSYRPALDRDDARRALLAGAGAQFDPRLVDVFLRNAKIFENEIETAGVGHEFESLEKGTKNELRTLGDSSLAVNYFEEIKRANLEVFALYDLARASSSSLNLEETVSFFVEKVQQLVPLDTCVVYLFNEARETAVAVHTIGKNAAILRNRKVKPGEGVVGFVLKNQKSVCSVSPTLDFGQEYLEIAQDYTTMAALPLKSGDKLVGAIAVYSENLLGYEEEHLRLLETVSHIAANAIWRTIQHAETESRALTDPMTGLPNARCLQLHFEKEAARSKRSNRPFQVVMLDLDEFKAVNDTFGHKVGDLLLKEISKVMRAQLREYDFLARYAGDEFVAVVPEAAGFPIEELCHRIEEAVLNFSLPVGGKGAARVGISIGAACYPRDGETLDQVLIAADHNMYQTKAAHKRERQKRTQNLDAPDFLEIQEVSTIIS
ncbi:MAG: diguanylate cyclase [Acidobacteriota bacterium]|nr:diguanylate cyclase [Acidobacteriota bacterium]